MKDCLAPAPAEAEARVLAPVEPAKSVYPPFEERLMLLYETWRESPVNSTAAALALAALLGQHPMVKKTGTKMEEQGPHSFKSTGFKVNPYEYRKWSKTPEGREYCKATGKLDCHGFDDEVYQRCPMLQKALPRGCHVVEALEAATGALLACFVFKGIPKFGGLQPTDEDEESPANANDFFINGKGIGDAKTVYVTEKSNGENAKIWGFVIGGVRYLLTGSKNTVTVTPVDALDALDASLSDDGGDHDEYPWSTIRRVVLQWYRSMTEEQRDLLFELFEKSGTLLGEINRPWAEHLVPIGATALELYTMLGADGHCVAPSDAFGAFKRLGLSDDTSELVRHVRYVTFSKGEAAFDFNAMVEDVRNKSGTEGCVLYLVGADNKVFGLVKVKTTWYVVWRRVRELLRTNLFGLLTRGLVRGVPATATSTAKQQPTKKKQQPLNEVLDDLGPLIEAGIDLLHFLPRWDSECAAWRTKALAFVAALTARLQVLFITECKAEAAADLDGVVSVSALDVLSSGVQDDAASKVLHAAFVAACNKWTAAFCSQYGTLVHQFERNLLLKPCETHADETGGGGAK